MTRRTRAALKPLLGLTLLLLAFGLGAAAPDALARMSWQRQAPELIEPARVSTVSQSPRDFPREAAAVRAALADDPPPAVLVELIERLGILGDEADFDLLDPLIEHPNHSVLDASLRAMARIGGDRALDRLSTLARSTDDTWAPSAIGALGLLSDPAAVDVLREVATRHIDWKRNIAVQALAMRGGPKARAALHHGLKTAPVNESWVWAQAVASLGGRLDRGLLIRIALSNGPRADAALDALATLNDDETDSLLIDLALTATGPRRVRALGSLAQVRSPEAVDVLVEALDGPQQARSAALDALGQSRAPGALDGLLSAIDGLRTNEHWQLTSALASRPEKQAREVLKVLAAEEGPLGDSALESLAQSGDPAAAKQLIANFDDKGMLPPDSALNFLAVHGGEEGWSLLEEVLADGNSSQQHSVVWALQARGDEDAVARLLDLAKTADPWVASTAQQSLETLGDGAREGLKALLLEQMDDGSGASFTESAAILARLGGDDARDVLLARVSDGTLTERSAALQALGQMDDPAARDALMEQLQDAEDPTVRMEAFNAMLWNGDPPDLETIQSVLDDDDPSLRSQAVTALGNVGGPEAVDNLLALMEDDDLMVRQSAVSTLSTAGGPEAEAGLVAALGDEELFSSAVWSLSSMGTAGAREAIREAAVSGEGTQRAEALGALGQDRSAEATELLLDGLRDEDEGVAVAALGQLQMRGTSSAANAVAELLNDLPEDEEGTYGMRWQAANALQGMGGPVYREHEELIQQIVGASQPWMVDESIEYEIEGEFPSPLDLPLHLD